MFVTEIRYLYEMELSIVSANVGSYCCTLHELCGHTKYKICLVWPTCLQSDMYVLRSACDLSKKFLTLFKNDHSMVCVCMLQLYLYILFAITSRLFVFVMLWGQWAYT